MATWPALNRARAMPWQPRPRSCSRPFQLLVVARVAPGEFLHPQFLILLHMLELMGPQRHIVLGIAGMAENDRVDQCHRIHIGVLQQGGGGADLLLVAYPEACGIEHGEVVPGFQLGADVQGNGFAAAGGGFVAGLAQGVGQAAGSQDFDILEHLAGLPGVDWRAKATHQAHLVLAGWAGLLRRGRHARQQHQQ